MLVVGACLQAISDKLDGVPERSPASRLLQPAKILILKTIRNQLQSPSCLQTTLSMEIFSITTARNCFSSYTF